MLLRHRPAPRSPSLLRITTFRRPQLPSTSTSSHASDNPITGRRPLVTRPRIGPWRRQTTPASFPGPLTQRPLATAVDADHLYSHLGPPGGYAQPLYHLRAFDPTTTLQIKIHDATFPRTRLNQQGIPGGLDEMVSWFDACLDVNKLERAALVLQRFAHMEQGLSYSDMIVLHNQYLRAGIARALEQPKSEWVASLHHWFEVEIRGRGIPHTPETIACMLKVSLLSAQGQHLGQFVNRYLDMLPEKTMWSVLDAGVLNHQDCGVIANIYQPASALAVEKLEPATQETQAEPTASAETPQGESGGTSTPVPDVLSVKQKGLGLQTLRKVLSFFNEFEGQNLSEISLEERREVQARLERDCVEAAIQRWREENQALAKMGLSTVSSGALNSQLYDWFCALEQDLRNEFKLFGKSEAKAKKTSEDLERCLYAPYMTQSTPARLAAVTIMGVLNALAQHGADKGAALATLLTSLSKSVEEDIRFQTRQRQAAAYKAEFRRARQLQNERPKEATDSPVPQSSEQATESRAQQSNGEMADSGVQQSSEEATESPVPQSGAETADSDVQQSAEDPSTTQQQSHIVEPPVYDNTTWPPSIKMKIGTQLLSRLLKYAKVNVVREHPATKTLVSQLQPALARHTVNRKGKRLGIVMPNKALVNLMKREPRGDYLARYLPMLVEPRPWTEFDKGGFLEFPSQLVRVKYGEKDQRIYAEAAIKRGDLDQVTKGLDVLGRTAWRINRPVFNVILEAWNSGEKIANIPPLNPDIPLPEEPDVSADPLARREWLKRLKLVENEKSGLHSERCFMNFQLDIARAFRDQTFYFPHNMDFRGRAYPIPAYLNHMGADHVRGILQFATGKELGESGFRWLKVQLANVFGYDKASFEERVTFATDHIKDVYDSAMNPLTGRRWWLKAEDPWQCLAACFELKAALDLPDPTKHVSHLPVAQDGTCNGLQHYAALGGDRWGAEQVNLMPGDRPADVYSAVADLVKVGIAEDLSNGNFLAKAVDGKITRKVVKQTVMTNVYGVTFIGAKAQVLKQLDAAYPDLHDKTGVPAAVLASYIATKIFKALSTMFRGAHDIQYWLGECAGRVCRALTPEQLERIASVRSQAGKKLKVSRSTKRTKANLEEFLVQFRSTIVWTTPLRMPIVQPYRKSGIKVIQTCMQDLTLQVPERSDPVNRRKQLQAFPPNFIHSLDASHMLLSALECDELGLTFAAVHDSFWTHAADVDVMSRVLRDAFIRIHSDDVIGRLASEFEARYKGSLYLAKILRNTDVERRISEHRSRERIGMAEELFQERERQRLLGSSDPKEVQKGMNMVTPASIYEQYSSSQALVSDDEIDEIGLGNITESQSETEDKSSEEPDFSAGEDSEKVGQMMNVTAFEASLKKMTALDTANSTKKNKVDYTHAWLPLTFPDIPTKGDFDVSELKSSKYFFS